MGRSVFNEDRVRAVQSRIRVSFLIFFMLSLSALLGAVDFELVLSTPPPGEVVPGQIVTIAVLVTNNTHDDLDFAEELSLPPGWRNVFGVSAFQVGADSFEIRLLSFLVPSTPLAGEYDVRYEVKDKRGESAELNFTVRVAASMSLAIRLVEAPSYVTAGEEYSVVFSVANNGNVPAYLELGAIDNMSYTLRLSIQRLQLQPSASGEVKVTVKTSAFLTEQRNHIIILTATGESGEAGLVSGRSSVLLLPPADSLANRFRVLPARLSITAGYSDGFLLNAALKIDGFLNDAKTRSISLNGSLPIIGKDEDNRFSIDLRYRGELHEVGYGVLGRAGLASVNLGTSARGFDLNLSLDSLRMGAILSEDLSILGLFADWNLLENLSAGVAVDGSFGSSNIIHSSLAIESGLEPVSTSSLLRVSFLDGKYDGLKLGYVFSSRLGYFQLRSAADYSKKISGQPGSEALKLDAAVVWQEPDSYRISFEGTVQRDNPFDLALQGLLNSYSLRGRFDFPTFSGLRMSMGGYYNSSGSRSLSTPAATLGGNLAASYYPGSFSLFGSLSAQLSRIENVDKKTIQLDVYGSYRLSGNAYLNARLTLKDYVKERFETTAALVGTLLMEDGYRFDGSLTYVMNNFDPVKLTARISFSKILQNGGSINVSASIAMTDKTNWIPSGAFTAGYSFPFSIPFWPRRDLGSLSGKIVISSEGNEIPLEGAVLKLNNLVAITGEDGRFMFSGLKPGTYFFDIDNDSLQRGLISSDRLPIEITISANEEKDLSITLVQSAALRVRVRNMEQTPLSIRGVNLVLESEDERFRLVTRDNGEISVPNLRPGKWLLRLEAGTLPKGFVADRDSVELELKPGDIIEVTLEIRKKSEEIIFIDSGVLD